MSSLSYSSIKTYEQCPLKYKLSRIDNLKEETGAAAERGKSLHLSIEQFLRGETDDIPEELSAWHKELSAWRQAGAMSEVQFALSAAWVPVEYDHPKAMLRGVIDFLLLDGSVAHVKDFKSGKERDYTDQLRVYAVAVLSLYANVVEVQSQIVYLDLGKTSSVSKMHRQDLMARHVDIEDRIIRIHSDTSFAPNPSFLCRYCSFRKANGGPCRW